MAVGSFHVQLEKLHVSGAALQSMAQYEGPVYRLLKDIAEDTRDLARLHAPIGTEGTGKTVGFFRADGVVHPIRVGGIHHEGEPGDLIEAIQVYEVETATGIEFLVGSELDYTAMEEFRHATKRGFLRNALAAAPTIAEARGVRGV